MLVTTQWPLKRAATSPHLSGCVFYGCLESLTDLSALWFTASCQYMYICICRPSCSIMDIALDWKVKFQRKRLFPDYLDYFHCYGLLLASMLVHLLSLHWGGVSAGSFNTSSPRQNGRQFPDDIFNTFSLNENIWISIEISMKFVLKSPINNIQALVHIMAWRRLGDKPLSEPIKV